MLGGNVFGWTVDESMSYRILDRAVDGGLTAIDTADVYSVWAPGHAGGESETIIGKWLKQSGNRDRIVIATKCGMEMAPERAGLSAKWIETAVEDSLRRLQTDYIDLYQAHRDDPKTPLEETMAAFGRLIEAGKVRAIGASNYTSDRLKEALETSDRLGVPRFATLQPLYNLVERQDFEGPLQQLCQEEKIAVIPYYALAAGFLTGKYRTAEDVKAGSRGYKVERYMNEKGQRVLSALEKIAGESRATMGQVAIAWLAAQPAVTAPIASATSPEQVDELVAAANLKLSADAVKLLDEASS
jgi:aryl-alcohol dehydrogenase-like predicted oxidoreductase